MSRSRFQSRVQFGIVCCLFLSVVLACRLGGLSSKGNLFEGNAVPEVVDQLKKKVGGPVKAISLHIEEDEMTLEAQDPKNPQHVDAYKYEKGTITGPTPVNLTKLIDSKIDNNVFNLDEVNIAAVPALVSAAISQTGLEGGKVTSMHLGRGFVVGKSDIGMGAPQWNIHVGGPRGDATVYANIKGEIIKINKL
jgi:hypothetical protein